MRPLPTPAARLLRGAVVGVPHPGSPISSHAPQSHVQVEQAIARGAAGALRRPGPLAWLLEGPGWTALRLLCDLLALLAACGLTVALGSDEIRGSGIWWGVGMCAITPALLAARGMYRRRLRVTVLDGVAPVVSAVSLATMIGIALEVLSGVTPLLPGDHVLLWALSLGLVGFERVALALTQRLSRRRYGASVRTLVVGAGEIGGRVAGRLVDRPEYGLMPVGFLDADPPEDRPSTGLPVLGAPDDLATVAPLLAVEHVVVAFSAAPDRELIQVVHTAQHLGLQVSLVPRFFDAVNGRSEYDGVGGLPMLGLRATDPHGPRFLVKHAVDRLVAGLALLVLSPLMLAIAVGVRASSPGPVIYRQRRIGQDGRPFDLLKFRSMAVAAPPTPAEMETWRGLAPGGVEGADRRTRIGRLLRRSSLDELPQLLNVVRGEMSLVGPRPERPDYVELFEQGLARYGERHRVRGGMTGWAQVHGLRGNTSLTERVELDNWYIEHWSLALDLKVVVLTLLAVLRDAE